MLLRKAEVEVGIVTDGQWWAIVWAKDGKPTGSGMVNALTWAEEPLLRDAFLTLIDQRASAPRTPNSACRDSSSAANSRPRRSPRRSAPRSASRSSSWSRRSPRPGSRAARARRPRSAHREAGRRLPGRRHGDDARRVPALRRGARDAARPSSSTGTPTPSAICSTTSKQQAADGEEHLDESYDAWHRLLAVSQALYAGVNYDEMRMPAYGGSLLDPDALPVAARHRRARAAAEGLRPGDAARARVGADGDGAGASATDLLPRHRRRADRLHLRGTARLHLRRRSKTTSCSAWSARTARSRRSTLATLHELYDDATRRQGVRDRAARLDQGGPAGGQAGRPRRSSRSSYDADGRRSRA